jgi:purine-binding chemotaxis protein CheW
MNTATTAPTIVKAGVASSATDPAPTQKFLTFCLGEEEYGLPILVVREIIGLMDITPLPRTPQHVKGVINLRGKIIPVIELRSRFGLASVASTPETCIIVVEVAATDASAVWQLGVIVDTVREVLDIERASIEPPPNFGRQIPLSAIRGMGKVKDKVVILLNIESVGGMESLQRAIEASEQAAGAGVDMSSGEA